MLQLINGLKRYLRQTIELRREYRNDYREYKRWNYNNPGVHSKNSFEAKILRQAHILEKGMALSRPRERFGVDKANSLIDFIEQYEAFGYEIDKSAAVLNAIGVLNAYLAFHRERGYRPEGLLHRFERLQQYLPALSGSYGSQTVTLDELQTKLRGTFPDFFLSRHSVRQFSAQKITGPEIRQAVKLAMGAPSACNRQSCKVYFYPEAETNRRIGKLIAGNSGFDPETTNYLVITSDLSAFYNAFERNQVYVDGGIFTMALVEALHYCGIASCILQNGESRKKNAEFKKICGNIPDNEKFILFIAVGHYPDTVTFAASRRKFPDDVFIVG